MESDEFAASVAGVAALAEPIRRELYLYVAAQPDAVSRDQASKGVGVPRHTAKFHLDRLVEEGVLEPEFRHLSARRGPGSGRPAKLYRRVRAELSVSLPERHYDLAGRLMAQAIDTAESDGVSVLDALHRAAGQAGGELGAEIRDELGARPSRETVRAGVCRALASHGYEPRVRGNVIELANCPFHALAREHTTLVCGMNLALLEALAERAAQGRLAARLEPEQDRCCVVLAQTASTP